MATVLLEGPAEVVGMLAEGMAAEAVATTEGSSDWPMVVDG